MSPTNPPISLVAELRRHDPELRIRWASRTSRWMIERKMPDRHIQLLREQPNPFKSARSWDIYDGWREGYVHVLSVHPTLVQNTALVMETLREADFQRQGGIEALNRKLDEQAEAEEQAADKRIATFCRDAALESFDRMKWLTGQRVAVTPPATRLASVVEHDGFLVRDRRIVSWPTDAR